MSSALAFSATDRLTIYLLEGVHSLTAGVGTIIANSASDTNAIQAPREIIIRSLLCASSSHTQCSDEPVQIVIGEPLIYLWVSRSLELRDLTLDGTAEADIEYSTISFIEVQASAALTLSSVLVQNFQQKYKSIIESYGATIVLNKVDFKSLLVHEGGINAVICQRSASMGIGSLIFTSGTIINLNSGYDPSSPITLQGFLYFSKASSVVLQNLKVTFNTVSDVSIHTSTSLVRLENIIEVKFKNCEFSHNLAINVPLLTMNWEQNQLGCSIQHSVEFVDCIFTHNFMSSNEILKITTELIKGNFILERCNFDNNVAINYEALQISVSILSLFQTNICPNEDSGESSGESSTTTFESDVLSSKQTNNRFTIINCMFRRNLLPLMPEYFGENFTVDFGKILLFSLQSYQSEIWIENTDISHNGWHSTRIDELQSFFSEFQENPNFTSWRSVQFTPNKGCRELGMIESSTLFIIKTTISNNSCGYKGLSYSNMINIAIQETLQIRDLKVFSNHFYEPSGGTILGLNAKVIDIDGLEMLDESQSQRILNVGGSYLLNDHNSSFSIKNAKFENNKVPQGIVVSIQDAQQVSISACKFSSNTSDGAVLSLSLNEDELSIVLVQAVVFESNVINKSGVVYFGFFVNSVIENSVFLKNTGIGESAGLFIDKFSENQKSFNIRKTQFIQNSSPQGSSIYVKQSGELLVLVIDSCDFLRNSGSQGTVLYISTDLAKDSSFSNNNVLKNFSSEGAVLVLNFSTTEFAIVKSVFKDNSSPNTSVLDITLSSNGLIVLSESTFEANTGTAVVAVPMRNDNIPRVSLINCKFILNLCISLRITHAYITGLGLTFEDNFNTPLYVNYGGVVEFQGTRFLSNAAEQSGGAALFSQNSEFRCTECEFAYNKASDKAGAIFAGLHSVLMLKNSKFIKNAAFSASALYISDSNSKVSTILNCTFTENSSSNRGSVFVTESMLEVRDSIFKMNREDQGTSPSINFLYSNATIANTTFTDQSSFKGSFIIAQINSNILLENSVFARGNAEVSGGAIYSDTSSVKVLKSKFKDCFAGSGGGISADLSDIIVMDSSFEDNSAKTLGADLALTEGISSITRTSSRGALNGSIYMVKQMSALINEATFSLCSGKSCVMSLGTKTLLVSKSMFKDNRSKVAGGCFFAKSQDHYNSDLKIEFTTFFNNSACEGGAIYLENVDFALADNLFLANSVNCSPSQGGAIEVVCINNCSTFIHGNNFTQNSASSRGGAIHWSSLPPALSNNSYTLNYAVYGADLASFTERLAYNTSMNLTELLVSGQMVKSALVFSLIDATGQVVSSDNSTVCGISSSDNVLLSGSFEKSALMGKFVFSDFSLTYPPGSNLSLAVTCRDASIQNVSIDFYLRSCESGESQQDNECLLCPEGLYSLVPSQRCTKCPSKAICYGGSKMAPKEGNWRASAKTDKFYKCIRSASCLPPDEVDLHPEGQCAEGYHGTLCSGCISGYTRSGRDRCTECSHTGGSEVVRALTVVGVVSFAVVSVVLSLRSAKKLKSLVSTYFKILTNFLQVTVILVHFKIGWPSLFLSLFHISTALSESSDKSMSAYCIFSKLNSEQTYYLNIGLVATIPFVVIGLAVAVWSLLRIYKKVEMFKEKVMGSVTVLVFLVHPYVTKTMFSLFSCEDVAGELWLSIDFSIKCWTSQHKFNVFALALPSLLVWQLFMPLICIVFLIRRRRSLDSETTKYVLGFLYHGFKPKWFFWEFVILYRKVMIIIVVVFMNSAEFSQAITAYIVLVIFYYMQIKAKPYVKNSLNLLEELSVFTSYSIMMSGLYIMKRETGEKGEVILFICLVLINSAFFLIWIRFTMSLCILKVLDKYPRLYNNLCCRICIFTFGVKKSDSKLELKVEPNSGLTEQAKKSSG